MKKPMPANLIVAACKKLYKNYQITKFPVFVNHTASELDDPIFDEYLGKPCNLG